MHALKDVVRRIGRFLLWPARRFFDPRLAGLEAAIRENVQVTIGATDLLGRWIAEVRAAVDEVRAEAEKASGSYFDRLARGQLSDLDSPVAAVLDRELT